MMFSLNFVEIGNFDRARAEIFDEMWFGKYIMWGISRGVISLHADGEIFQFRQMSN